MAMKLEWEMTILTSKRINSLGYFEYEIQTVFIFRRLFVSRFAQEMKHKHKYDNLLIKYVLVDGQNFFSEQLLRSYEYSNMLRAFLSVSQTKAI